MKANSFHPIYAAEILLDTEKWNHSPIVAAGRFVSTYEVRPLLDALADEIGSEKLASIAATVAEIEDQRKAQGGRCRRYVTDAQRAALSKALLEKYGTPRNIVKAAWGLTDEEIDAAGR